MRAIYAFSGDPITSGHIDVVCRAATTYDEVTVAIGENPSKQGQYLFSLQERLCMAEKCFDRFPNVSCLSFTGLLGEYAYRNGFDVIVKGVRNNSDLEGELVQFAVNETLHPTVDTVFFPTRPHLSHISSGVVKAIVAEGGDTSDYCPLFVKEELEKKILNKFTIGVAGGIASGKTHIARKLVAELGRSMTASYVSMDDIGHYVLESSSSSIYSNTGKRLAKRFGDEILNANGAIDRHVLGQIVFQDPIALASLNAIMREPMLARLYELTRELPVGVIVIEGAILVEAKWTNLVNNNVILVDAPEDVRLRRLVRRSGIKEAEALTKIKRQISAAQRRSVIKKRIEKNQWGRLWHIDNNTDDTEIDLDSIIDEIIRITSSTSCTSSDITGH